MSHHNSSGSHDISHELGHIVPVPVYAKVLVALLILTGITVGVAHYNFGNWNIIVAMLVASVKAGLVTLFFMHLKYESPITWLYVLFPIVLLMVMLGGIFIDNPLRSPVSPIVVGSDHASSEPSVQAHEAPAEHK